jgi:hypothetical protein
LAFVYANLYSSDRNERIVEAYPPEENSQPAACLKASPAFSPQGIDIPGSPAKFAGIVKISCKYISVGSSLFSPALKAVPGVVGDKITSTVLKASEKSFATSCLHFWALR